MLQFPFVVHSLEDLIIMKILKGYSWKNNNYY